MEKFSLSSREWKKTLVTPKVSAAGIVESPDRSSILIVKRKFEPLGYACPGGMMDIGETISECAVREVLEETNISAFPLGLFKVSSNPNADPRFHVVIAYVILSTKDWGDPVGMDDAKEAFWMNYKSNDYFNEMILSCQLTLKEYRRWRLSGENTMLPLD